MGFVDDGEEVTGEKVDQRVGPGTGRAATGMAGVILDAIAVAHLLHHFQIEGGPHLQALRFEELALALQLRDAFVELLADRSHGNAHFIRRSHIVPGSKNGHLADRLDCLSRGRIEAGHAVDLVAEELDPERILGIGGAELHRIAAHSELAPAQFVIVALVLHLHQPGEERLAGEEHPGLHGADHTLVVLRGTEAINAGDTRHHDDIPAGEEGTGRRQAQALDFLVHAGVFLDVGIRPGDVGFRLVVIEVGDEVLHGILREELLELAVELGRQGLVVGEDQRRAVERLDDIGHGEGLPGTGHAQEGGVILPGTDPPDQLLDRLGLIAERGVGAMELKGHPTSLAANG